MPVYYDQEEVINSFLEDFCRMGLLFIDISCFTEWLYKKDNVLRDNKYYKGYEQVFSNMKEKFPTMKEYKLVEYIYEFMVAKGGDLEKPHPPDNDLIITIKTSDDKSQLLTIDGEDALWDDMF